MGKLNTIQKRENLNEVYHAGELCPDGAISDYKICPADSAGYSLATISFQKGPRNDSVSRRGVTEQDLLEIVRDRLKSFQSGPYATRENACALTHIEEALMWLNRRVEDRIERGVLGTMEK